MSIEREMEKYFDELFPICRSITGKGFQQSLDIIREIIPLDKIDFLQEQIAMTGQFPLNGISGMHI